jgi:hypothetical protein
LAEDTRNERFIQAPINPADLKPVQTDTELAKDLLRVTGRTAIDKVILKRISEDGKTLLGYEIVDQKNLFFETITEDMTKSNLGMEELKAVRGHCLLSSYTQAISKDLQIDLSSTQKFLADNLLMLLASSRGKGGWNAMLSKTDKTITQQSIEEFTKQLQFENKKPKWKFW